jgi:hypothetical protein
MLRSGNIVLLTLRFLNVGKFINLTPLSLLILCKLLSFPIVGLKMSSLPTLVYLLSEVSYGILGIYQTHVPIPRRLSFTSSVLSSVGA